MDRTTVCPLAQAYRLLNPGCVLLVSVGDAEADNLFALTWNMPVRRDPPMVAILSGKGHYSYPFMQRTGEFALNVPDAGLVDAVLGCGSTTGRDGLDKFARFGLSRAKATRIAAPLVAEAVASLECCVAQVVDLGSSALLVAQIVHAVAAADHFRDGQWRFDRGLRLLHHLGGERFCVSDRAIDARPP
ncbi:MAG: flavin reductase family protein [Deltaproteobacteria bacterium]|nr:flavin reductase family protein [Deltaproteobacteria bacterium]